MKFSSIKDEFFGLYITDDDEVLHNKNEKRPYLIIITLKYKNCRHDFALPLRSNLANYTPKEQYFALPPSRTTMKNKVHGIHYIKMFPVVNKYLKKFHYDKDNFYTLIHKIVIKNKDRIINEAQKYLENYETGERVQYASKIDKIFAAIYSKETIEEVAVSNEKINE